MSEDFGLALRALRVDAGVGLAELAHRSGIARSHLYRLENGESSEPTADTLMRIAQVLGIEAEALNELSWEYNRKGPGLPSLPTYLTEKYGLTPEQLRSFDRSFKRIVGTTP